MDRVLVTGAAGFIGHHIVEDLLPSYEVVALCSMSESGNLNRLSHLKQNKNLKVFYHDLACELSQHLMEQIGHVDYILHVAAQPHVDKSIQNPRKTVYSNVIGTLNILEFARTIDNLKHLIYFSTDEVFGPAPKGEVFDEYSRYNSTNPYSASKAGGEELANSYYYTYKMPISITHTMNVFGERQQREAFIPICIGKLSRGETITLHMDDHGNLPSRHYLYVKDVSKGTRMIMERPFIRENRVPKYNMGKHDEHSILEIAEIVAKTLNVELKVEAKKGVRKFVDSRYALSTDKMESLGWKPDTDFETKLKEVVQWYTQNSLWI